MFLETTVYHLPRTYSDHNPILIKSESYTPLSKDRPFHFQTIWMLHGDFKKIPRESWNLNINPIIETMKNLTEAAKDFNSNLFGNIFKKKRNTLAQIEGTQKSLLIGSNSSLYS